MTKKEIKINRLKKYIIFFFLGICTITAVFVGCQGKKSNEKVTGEQPNILLITIDTLRADHLSVYGCNKHETRHIDQLAKEGVVFDFAYCDVNWTTPSMASTLTGIFANKHGLRSMYTRLPHANQTITESLKTAGYSTAAVIGAFPLDSIYGLDQGFDVYNDSFSDPIYVGSKTPPQDIPSQWGKTVKQRKQLFFTKIFNKSRRSDEEVTTAAIDMLKKFKKNANKPFFLWVHYFGPHAVPDIRRSRLENWKNHAGTYSEKVLNTDKAVGNLLSVLDSLKLSNHTLVILHADHGESLWEHGFVGHGVYLYEDNLHIPLIMRWPGQIPKGRRVPQLVGNVDIAATIADAAGIPGKTLEKIDGKSLFPAIHKGKTLHKYLYFETYLCAHDVHAEIITTGKEKKIRVGIRSYGILKKPWKYIKTDIFPLFDAADPKITKEIQKRVERHQLFNLRKDPGELHSMAQTPKGNIIMREIKHLLAKYTVLDKKNLKNRMRLTKEQLEKLKSLGYLD